MYIGCVFSPPTEVLVRKGKWQQPYLAAARKRIERRVGGAGCGTTTDNGWSCTFVFVYVFVCVFRVLCVLCVCLCAFAATLYPTIFFFFAKKTKRHVHDNAPQQTNLEFTTTTVIKTQNNSGHRNNPQRACTAVPQKLIIFPPSHPATTPTRHSGANNKQHPFIVLFLSRRCGKNSRSRGVGLAIIFPPPRRRPSGTLPCGLISWTRR